MLTASPKSVAIQQGTVMSATVETLEGLERRISININAAAVETEVGKRLQKMSKNVKLDGFRPGKAPLKMVTMRYGREVRGEVLGDALQQQFVETVKANPVLMWTLVGVGVFTALIFVFGILKHAFKAAFLFAILSVAAWIWYFNVGW